MAKPAPMSTKLSIHWSTSIRIGANRSSLSMPEPHSRLVNVFMPTWVKPVTSSHCQTRCRRTGTMADALARTRSKPSHSRTGRTGAGRIADRQSGLAMGASTRCDDGDPAFSAAEGDAALEGAVDRKSVGEVHGGALRR